jgi:hypothetical protein
MLHCWPFILRVQLPRLRNLRGFKRPCLRRRSEPPGLPQVSSLARPRVSQATFHMCGEVVRLPLLPRRIHLRVSQFGRAACWTGVAASPRLRAVTSSGPSPQGPFPISTPVSCWPLPRRSKCRKQWRTCSAKRLGWKRSQPERWARLWDRWGRGVGCCPRCWSHHPHLAPLSRLLSTRRYWDSALTASRLRLGCGTAAGLASPALGGARTGRGARPLARLRP